MTKKALMKLVDSCSNLQELRVALSLNGTSHSLISDKWHEQDNKSGFMEILKVGRWRVEVFTWRENKNREKRGMEFSVK